MLFLDTSALVKRYVEEPGTDLVLERMAADTTWVVSSLARTEAEITLCRLGFAPDEPDGPRSRLAEDWERCLLVPVDPAGLARAAEIGCEHGMRTLDALHLAAADRLPRPVEFLTFDQRQATAARSLGMTASGA